jgi:pseudaminic acid synthase
MKIKVNKQISFDYNKRPLIISEISGNHAGNKKKFLNLILTAKKRGADLVKIQTYEPDDITLRDLKLKINNGIWKGKKIWELYKKACTPYEWHHDAFKLAKKHKINLFSTPFSLKALNFLEKKKVDLYKISSFEITDLNLINEIAKTKKPIIMSTGLSSISEIKNSLKIINKFHNKVIIMHCVSEYPTRLIDTNLARIKELKKVFKKNMIGLSDHTDNIISSVCATTLGIVAIEKHIKLKKKDISEDSKFSIIPKELEKLRHMTEEIFESTFKKKYFKINKKNLFFRRSIFSNKNLKKNDSIKIDDIKTLRPKIGIDASMFYKIINKKLKKNINKNNPIFWKDLI